MAHADGRRFDEALLQRAALAALSVLAGVLVTVAALDWALRPDNFPVRNVRFEGEFRRVGHAELAVAVSDAVRGNFLLVDLDAVKRRVETLPWVHRAAVRRQWPSDVYVQFEEQQIVARWGDAAWVNHVGEAVVLPNADLPADIPLLSGPAGTSAQVLGAYQRMSPVLAEQGLALVRLALTPRRTWELEITVSDSKTKAIPARTDAPGAAMKLVLDRHEPDRKLERFVRAYAQGLALQATRIRQVDLRYANGFAVEWKTRTEAGDVQGRTNAAEGWHPAAAKEG
jgi:cell division protein FtsQ